MVHGVFDPFIGTLSPWCPPHIHKTPPCALPSPPHTHPHTHTHMRMVGAPLHPPMIPTHPHTYARCPPCRMDGSKFLQRLQVSPLYDNSGHVSHLLGVMSPAHKQDGAPASLLQRLGLCQEEGVGLPNLSEHAESDTETEATAA